MNKISMQYPFDPLNPYYDGLAHDIVPTQFIRVIIDGRLYYAMTYNDLTLGRENFITLITWINGQYCKIPLDGNGYAVLCEYLHNHPELPVYSTERYRIKQPIAVGMTMTLDPAVLGRRTRNSKCPLIYYVPINVGGNTSVPHCTFRNAGMTMGLDNPAQVYDFKKTPLCDEFSRGLIYGLDHYRYGTNNNSMYYNDIGVKKYEFDVDIVEGTTSVETFVDKEGKERRVLRLMIPGTYHITGYYSDFVSLMDYSDALDSKDMFIRDEEGRFEDLHDTPIVFKDGGIKELEMTFVTPPPNDGYYFKR